MTGKVVVTDGTERAALASVRSLGKSGFQVFVIASRAGSLAASSRFCTGSFIAPDSLAEPDLFADRVLELTSRLDAALLLPISEASALAVLPRRAEIVAAIPFPRLEDFTGICDKARVLAAAATVGIAVPKQIVVNGPGELISAVEMVGYPAVLKPSRSVVDSDSRRHKTAVSYVHSAAEAAETARRTPIEVYPLLVQRRLVGRGHAISVILWDGDLKAAFAHQRVLEKPPSGGVSVLRQSIPLDRDLLERSLRLLRQFSWQGVAMVEFKDDDRTGVPHLMEVNGRMWGSVQLAIDAGVDFPSLLARCALADSPSPTLGYRTGVRTRWEWGEIDHLLSRLFRSREDLSLPSSSPSRMSTVVTILGSFLRDRGEVLRLGDPKPFFAESAQWLRSLRR
jgi:predicted ATP-grasp superfamily ATP-dependent carboligase